MNYSPSQPRRRGFKILPLLVFALFAAIYIFSNQETVPITGRSQLVDMSREEEAALGLQSYTSLLSQVDTVRAGPEVDLIRSIGTRLAKVSGDPGFDWEFNLIRSPEANAFCLPGGKVAVHTGILPYTANPDGLAVVMGHAIARHGAERMTQERLLQMGQLALGMSVSEMDEGQRRAVMGAFGLGARFGVLLPYSRSHESEADHIGLIILARACFDPREAPAFWTRMSSSARGTTPPEFLSTHPSHENRIEQLRALIPEALAEREKACGT